MNKKINKKKKKKKKGREIGKEWRNKGDNDLIRFQ